MLKSIVAWWGRNAVAGNLMMAAGVILGLLSFFAMEKEFWPAGRGDNVSINAFWPGASPDDMESQVIARVEEAVADLDGVNWIRSRSGEGFGWVNISVNPGVDVDAMTSEVKSRMDSISTLPPTLEPLRVQRGVGRNWSMIYSVHGSADEKTIRDTGERLRDKLAVLDGAANTIVVGARRPEVSIELSEAALKQYSLTFDEVARAIRSSSLNVSAGNVRTEDGDYQLRARNLADTRIDFQAIVVRQTADGGIVRLGDIGKVNDGFEDVNVYSRMNGDPSVLVTVLTGDRFNIWKLDKAVAKTLKEFKQTLPAGIEITTVYNESEDFTALTSILFSNALQGFFLIFVLLLLTLHPKVAFWATAGVITAFAGSFFILPYVDVSLNFMSVFGFLLVLGIMVDDAIIVGEAVYERVERGEKGADAAILATQLVLKPLMASVFVTMIAFSPLMFISGDARQFTRAISIVVMSTLAFSLIESLLILPAHLAGVKPHKRGGTGVLNGLMDLQQKCAHGVLWVARNLHGPLVKTAVRWRYLTATIAVGCLCLALALMTTGRVKQTFMPEIEGDFVIASVDLPQSTPFRRMEEVAAQLDKARLALEAETAKYAYLDPNTNQKSRGVVRSWSQSIEENSIRAYIGLTPPPERPDLRTKAVTERLKELLGPVPDADRINFSFGGGGGGPAIEIALLSSNQDDLRSAVEELKAKLLSSGQVQSVKDSDEAALEELRFTLKPGAEQLGLTLQDVTRQVRQAYFGEEVQRLPRDGDDVRVYLRYPRDDRRTLDSLEGVRIRTADGREVPLDAVAEAKFAPGVTGIDRRQRQRSILVEAEAPKEARAIIMKELDTQFFKELEKKYPTVSRKAIGEAEGQKEFQDELGRLGLMALFVMYFLLAVVFRSYLQPLLIMSVILFALMGAVVGHYLFGISFALFSYFGVIAAAGVVVNDNVVLVDKINQLRTVYAVRPVRAGVELGSGLPGRAKPITHEVEGWEIAALQEDGDFQVARFVQSANEGFANSFYSERSVKELKLADEDNAREHGWRFVGVSAPTGAVSASVSRFRQIFLTSVTEFVGMSPMILESAVIAQFLKPMAISLAFGVLFCMPITLILTPSLYMIGKDIKSGFGAFGRFLAWGWNGRRQAGPAPAE